MKLKQYAIKAATWSMVTVGAISIALEAVQAVTFSPPSDNSAPTRSTGGASRSQFLPPSGNGAPTRSTGGASRSQFLPPSDNSAPSQSTGVAARSQFLPPSDNSAPSQSTGGASRSQFLPPSDNSAPSHAAGGASRIDGQTSSEEPSIVALLPENFYGTTLSSHPTILVYVPESSGGEAIFSLKDPDGEILHTTSISVSGKAGIVTIELPEEAPGLEAGRMYQWYFALKLDGQLSPKTPFVDGLVKRITPSAELARSLEGKTPLQQSAILATNGVWYDSASLLAALQVIDPLNPQLVAEWTELLDSVNLSQLTNASLVPTAD
ncbi:DUF928 domain-containing protein [Roseofilum casamattae]|uniref:DUF928 domain-containing protein n=1 Tax=Roseofilum casamattae BLCC-M143 TaxID=3022442 RepID=A0ABT7BV13_9CYAN|nr:DUF928 domain-containing protein [Roseofilum casamattae]MDJ1182301.1 DUF928 domain-containing protein [Roseofilum casamattae BLCC-M143]